MVCGGEGRVENGVLVLSFEMGYWAKSCPTLVMERNWGKGWR